MSILIKGMEKPISCDDCIVPLSKCDFLQKRADECPIIEIDDTVWENEKYKLIRMTNEARFNKAMAERRADGDI